MSENLSTRCIPPHESKPYPFSIKLLWNDDMSDSFEEVPSSSTTASITIDEIYNMQISDTFKYPKVLIYLSC
jgi:hypothetical protein